MPARPIEDTATSPYAVLGVSRHASVAQIKQAYRDRAKAAHPDAGGSAAAMARVNEAYRILNDPARRKEFDYRAAAAADTVASATPTRPPCGGGNNWPTKCRARRSNPATDKSQTDESGRRS